VDGVPLRLKPGAPLSFARTPKGWAQAIPPATDPPVRGPIVQAVNGRHLYVYGVDDPQGSKDAEAAAAWSSSRVRITLTLQVKADKDVTIRSASADLVPWHAQTTGSSHASPGLPGTRSRRRRLRTALRRAAGRHRAGSSGRAWWTADEANAGVMLRASAVPAASTFGDTFSFRSPPTCRRRAPTPTSKSRLACRDIAIGGNGHGEVGTCSPSAITPPFPAYVWTGDGYPR
jgi:hypothetical protein